MLRVVSSSGDPTVSDVLLLPAARRWRSPVRLSSALVSSFCSAATATRTGCMMEASRAGAGPIAIDGFDISPRAVVLSDDEAAISSFSALVGAKCRCQFCCAVEMTWMWQPSASAAARSVSSSPHVPDCAMPATYFSNSSLDSKRTCSCDRARRSMCVATVLRTYMCRAGLPKSWCARARNWQLPSPACTERTRPSFARRSSRRFRPLTVSACCCRSRNTSRGSRPTCAEAPADSSTEV
mmetsp:Transcript_31672/g.97925  ORF Transcript_31672/g.97925 Transcript_31672/m.97925 type:complete len:239 (-) Transcript_31672:1002-1718(-)